MPTSITLTAPGGGTRRVEADDLLSADARDLVKVEANAWIKRLRLVDYDGQTMRQRFVYRGDSLWWFTEIYLHKTRTLERAIHTILALEAAVLDAPAGITVETTDPTVRAAARAFGAARHVTVDLAGRERGDTARTRLQGFATGATALLSRMRSGRNPAPVSHPRVAAFVHSAFWRDEDSHSSGGRENYVGPVLDAVAARVGPDGLRCIGVGPRRNFRNRRWWDPIVRGPHGRAITPIEELAPRRALAESLALWRNRRALAHALTSGPAIRDAGRWRDYDLWPVLRTSLERAAELQWPWSARSMDEARSALARLAPEVVVTYAEAGGWGRALLLETRRGQIPSVGLQHGFIYRHWLNYRHEPDEMSGEDGGFPRPDVTLVFDGVAAGTLSGAGHFPPAAIVVTGSPRLDELAAEIRASAAAPAALRASLGIGSGEHVVVIAAKFTEIAGEIPSVLAAIESIPGVRGLIKPHPAEPADIYRPALSGLTRTAVADPAVDLGSLLSIAEACLTMNSTAALDATALGIPAVVVGLPNNLGPFVDAGVMIGASRETLRAVLEGVLYDRTVRDGLLERGRAFADAHRMAADGRAAERAAAAVLEQMAAPRRGTSGSGETR